MKLAIFLMIKIRSLLLNNDQYRIDTLDINFKLQKGIQK